MEKALNILLTSALFSVLFLGGASLAFAATVTPLSFFCAPYTTSFIEGQAYIPADHDSTGCTFDTNAGNWVIVYRGTVGSAQFLRFGLADNTTFSLGDVVFTGGTPPVPGDSYFGVSFAGDIGAYNSYFSGGGDAPGDYSVVNWHWGTPATVTADDQTVVAGSALPALTATVSGFIDGESLATSGITGSASCVSSITDTSVVGDYPNVITCTRGSLSSTKYSFTAPTALYAPGTLHIIPPPPPPPPTDTEPPTITINTPLKNGVYAKTDSVFLAATVTDVSPIATTTYWFGNKKINPALPLPLSTVKTPSIQSVSVSAKDIRGNTATSTLKFFVVKTKNSCMLDIIALLVAITKDKTLPDKPTIQNLIADCSALLIGLHRFDIDGHRTH